MVASSVPATRARGPYRTPATGSRPRRSSTPAPRPAGVIRCASSTVPWASTHICLAMSRASPGAMRPASMQRCTQSTSVMNVSMPTVASYTGGTLATSSAPSSSTATRVSPPEQAMSGEDGADLDTLGRLSVADEASRRVTIGRVGWADIYTQDEFRVLVAVHVELVAVETARCALAAMAHLGIRVRHHRSRATPWRMRASPSSSVSVSPTTTAPNGRPPRRPPHRCCRRPPPSRRRPTPPTHQDALFCCPGSCQSMAAFPVRNGATRTANSLGNDARRSIFTTNPRISS